LATFKYHNVHIHFYENACTGSEVQVKPPSFQPGNKRGIF